MILENCLHQKISTLIYLQTKLMKHLLLFILLVVVYSASIAQINQGACLVGSQVNLNFLRNQVLTNGTTSTLGILNLSLGKAYKTNHVFGGTIGVNGNWNITRVNGVISSRSTLRNYSAGVFHRNYFKLGGKILGFVQSDAGLNYGINRYTASSGISLTTQTQVGIFVHLTPGVAYPVAPNIWLEFSVPSITGVSYTYTRNTDPQTGTLRKQNAMDIYTRIPTLTNLNWLGVGFRVMF